MQRDLKGIVEAHVEAQYATSAYQLEHALFVRVLEAAIFTAGVRTVHQVVGVAHVERAIGDFFDEVGQFEMRFLVVLQGKRVAFAGQLNDEGALCCAAFDLKTERQAFALGRCTEDVVEGLGQVDLGIEQLQRAVVDFVLDHATFPSPLGSDWEGAVRTFSFGLLGINAQPHFRASRRISKIWMVLAAAGWM